MGNIMNNMVNNTGLIYQLIDKYRGVSRIQLAELSQLAPASVTNITRHLLQQDFIKEVEQQLSTGGRRAVSLTINESKYRVCCVKVGRNHLYMGWYDLCENLLAQETSTFSYVDGDSLSEGIIEQLTLFIRTHLTENQTLLNISLTLSGLINSQKGIIEYMPNIQIKNYALTELISSHFAVDCFIGNTIRALALSERYFGASQDVEDSLFVRVHHGVASGIISQGEIFLGANNHVGELGHIQVDPLGDRCQCGNLGCLETICSNDVILDKARQMLELGEKSLLDKDDLNMAKICDAALKQDPLALNLLTHVATQLGRVLAIVVNLFNPQKIILSGELFNAEKVIFPILQRTIERQSLSSLHIPMKLCRTTLDKNATLGAYAIAKRAVAQQLSSS